MAKFIDLPTFTDDRGSLTVIEKILPFEIKRIYYIYDTTERPRGGHRHKKVVQALICLAGSCDIDNHNGITRTMIRLDSPKKCLIIEPEDYHTMVNFAPGTVLLVLCSEYYDNSDYIDEPYD